MGFINWLLGKSKERKKQEEREFLLESRFKKWEESLNEITRKLDDKVNLPGIKLIKSNETATVIVPSGAVYVVQNCTEDMFQKIKNCQSEEEIRKIVVPDEAKEEEVQKEKKRVQEELDNQLVQTIDYLVDSGEFERDGNAVYMKGIPVSVPRVLIDRFTGFIKEVFDRSKLAKFDLSYMEDKYLALKRFWMWCSLNPDPNVREDLFKFLQNHDIEVNRNGFFFTYRRVVTKKGAKEQDLKLTKFVSSEYLKVRTKWKKNPANYLVAKLGEGEYQICKQTKEVVLGTLSHLYETMNESTEQVFTDKHTGTFDIRIGKEVRISKKDCDNDNTRDCSQGLHSGNKNFGYSGFGDTAILCLINPIDVVSVPVYNVNKMRSCAYLPVAILDMNESTTFLEKAEVLDLCDKYYTEEVEKLEKMVEGNQPIEIMKHEFGPKDELTNEDQITVAEAVLEELDTMKSILASRVKKV